MQVTSVEPSSRVSSIHHETYEEMKARHAAKERAAAEFKSLRKELGLSQGSLAQALRVPRRTLEEILREGNPKGAQDAAFKDDAEPLPFPNRFGEDVFGAHLKILFRWAQDDRNPAPGMSEGGPGLFGERRPSRAWPEGGPSPTLFDSSGFQPIWKRSREGYLPPPALYQSEYPNPDRLSLRS